MAVPYNDVHRLELHLFAAIGGKGLVPESCPVRKNSNQFCYPVVDDFAYLALENQSDDPCP